MAPSPSDKHQKWLEEADAWYFNLETMAKRIEANELRAHHLRRRQWVAIIFFFCAFMLISYRSEVNSDRIDGNTKRLIEQQRIGCISGLAILVHFNEYIDEEVAITEEDPNLPVNLKVKQLVALKKSKISPLPVCEMGKK